jgi:hypothetical protein
VALRQRGGAALGFLIISNMNEIVQLNSKMKLSEHFTLGEMTKSNSHPEIYNIPSHEAIANLKRLCVWLEELRRRYNDKYVVPQPLSSRPSEARGEISPMRPGAQAASRKDSSTSLGMTNGGSALGMTSPSLSSRPSVSSSLSSRPSAARGEISEEPIRLNSGYRSPQLNRAIGGVSNSNHLTGCAVDIRVENMEQLIRYAAILLDISNETHQDFDELLIEKNRYGAIWLHFAVRPSGNRRKILFINA